MPDTLLVRLRESLQRSQAGDPAARDELDAELRALSDGEYREVLARWRQARMRGDRVSIEEMCAGNAAGAATVSQVIQLVEDAHAWLTATATVAKAPPPGVPADPGAAPLPRVSGYEVLSVLKQGGMGIVY